MEQHIEYLRNICRICGERKVEDDMFFLHNSDLVKRHLLSVFEVNVSLERIDTFPQKVCDACRRKIGKDVKKRQKFRVSFEKLKEQGKLEVAHLPSFLSHTDANCVCIPECRGLVEKTPSKYTPSK